MDASLETTCRRHAQVCAALNDENWAEAWRLASHIDECVVALYVVSRARNVEESNEFRQGSLALLESLSLEQLAGVEIHARKISASLECLALVSATHRRKLVAKQVPELA